MLEQVQLADLYYCITFTISQLPKESCPSMPFCHTPRICNLINSLLSFNALTLFVGSFDP